MTPLYTPDNCVPAYQLRWSLSLFAETPLPESAEWLSNLKSVVEPDGVRILECAHHVEPTWQFLLSTQPRVAPPEIVKSVKGRLQHVLQARIPRAFRRNFRLTSVGEARSDVVESYVASQLQHHRMPDHRSQELLSGFQLSFSEIDLSTMQNSAHGQYNYSLHLVFVNDGRWSEVDAERFGLTRDMVINSARKKAHRLSRLALLADHVHLSIGCPYQSAPQDVALAYMNNIAYAQGMTPLLMSSYYVGTIGDYDMNAVRRSLQVVASTDAGSEESESKMERRAEASQ